MVTANRESLWSRDYLLIILTAFFAVSVMFTMGSGMTLLVNQNGGGTSVTGIMVFGSSVGSILGSLLGGRLCDTWGTRKVLMTFSIGCAVVTFLPAVFSSFTMLVVLRFLQGLLYPSIFVAIPAAVAKLAPAKRLGEAMGYCGTVMALSETIGPTVAIRAFAADKADALLTVCAGLFLLAFVLPLSCRYENRPAAPAPKAAPGRKTEGGLLWRLLEKKALGLAIFNLMHSVALCIVFNYLPLYVAKSGIRHYGIYYILQFVSMVASRLTTGKLIDRRGPIRAFLPAVISGILSFLLILTGNSFLFLLSGIFYGLYSGVMSLLQAVCMRYRAVEPRRRRHGHAEYIRQHRHGAGGPASGESSSRRPALSMRLYRGHPLPDPVRHPRIRQYAGQGIRPKGREQRVYRNASPAACGTLRLGKVSCGVLYQSPQIKNKGAAKCSG
jgi:MFS family permease